MSEGLRPGSYATPNGDLTPLQARLELSLNPAKSLPDAQIGIDLEGLARDGYELPSMNRVQNWYGMPGGGTEMQFPYAIPPNYLTRLY